MYIFKNKIKNKNTHLPYHVCTHHIGQVGFAVEIEPQGGTVLGKFSATW